MKQVAATVAPKPRSHGHQVLAWVYAAILVVMALGQLFAFEDFIPLIESYLLPGGYRVAVLVACLVVVAEIFALPFLLRMRVSEAMRWFGAVCCLIVPVAWFALAFYNVLVGEMLASGGMFGAVDAVAVSTLVQLVVAAFLSVVATFAVDGLRPRSRS